MLSKFNELQTEKYSSSGNDYDLTIYKSQDSNEIRVNISTGEQGKNILWTLEDLEVSPEITDESTLITKCLSLAKSAIRENEFNK